MLPVGLYPERDLNPTQFSLPYTHTKPDSDNNLPGLPAHDNTSQPNLMRDFSPENVTRRALANATPQPMQYLPKEEWDKEISKKEAIQQGLQEIAAHSTRSTTDFSQPISVTSVTHPSDLSVGEWYNAFASDTYTIQKEAGRIYQMWQVGAIDEDEARSRFHQLYVSPQTAQSRNFVRSIDEKRNFRRNNAAIDAAEAEITKKLQAAAAQKPTQPIPMPYMGDARISDSIDEQYYKQSLRLLDDARKISRAYADNNHNGTSTAKRVLRGIGDNLITPEAITMGFSAIADNANLMRILEKDERGEQLSDAEETLLSAAIIKQYTEAAYASGTGIAYNIGAVTGESLPYMLSFVVTGIPIKAATSGISKRIVKFVGRQLQRKGIGRIATRATKTTLGLGGNIATSALQAPIMPSTYSDYLDRRIGTIDSTTDGMGNISFSHQGDSRSTAALKAYFNTFYQNFGERSGEAISSLWGMFGRGIGKIPIGRGKSINDIFNTIHDSRLGKFWDTMQGTAVADFMRQANYDGVFAEVVEEYISGILNAATIGDQSFEELFSQDNLLTTMGGIALTSVMLGSANATLGVAATQRIRSNFNRSSKAAQQYFSPEQLNQLIGISGGSVQDITTFLAANIARRQLIARQISQLAARQRNGETGIEAQINTLGAELQDLRMQYDFVNASAMYNAYIGGLSRRIEPMREQARAAIRANGDPATGLTIQVNVNGRQGYLIGGNYNHIQDADGNISVTPTGDLATVLFDGDKTPTPNIPMETLSILGVRRTDDVIRDGDRAIFAATEQQENAAQAPATGSTVTVSGSNGNFILQGYDPQGNAIVTPLNSDGTPAVKNGKPISASVPSENIIPEEADNTSASLRSGSIAYIDGIPYAVDQVDGENAIIHRLNSDGTPLNDVQGNPITSIVPIATLSSSPHPAQHATPAAPQNAPDGQQTTPEQSAAGQDAAIEETNTQQQPAIVDDNITETPSSALSRIPIDKNGKPIYEQSDPETAYDAILQQAEGDTALASRVILSMIDNKEAALKKLSKAKPRRADNPADIIKAEKELAAQIKQAESNLQFWKNTALVPSLRNHAQKEAETNSVIQDHSLADTPDSRTRDNDGSGNHQGIGAIQANVASIQENSEERLTHEEALAIISDMEKHAEVAPEIELTPENWVKEFGNDGIVNTPIGEVKQGDNQYLKLAQQGRNSKLGMVRPTLERPSIIILDERPAREGKSDRDTSFVFIKTFIKEDGTRYYYFTSVTVSKEGKEVVISSQERSANRISKLLQQGKIAWIDTAFSLHPTTQVEGSVPLNDSNMPTVTDNQPALLGINSSELSQNKDNEKSPISSDLGEKIAAAEAQTETKPSQAQKQAETKHPGTTSSFDDIHPIGHGAFGDIYDQFKGKPQEAIEFLSEKQGGEAIGALHHKDVGDISLVWGNDKAGLKKILAKHPEVTNDIQGILEDMRVIEESDNRIKLDSPTHFAVVSKEIFGTPRDKWLLTAYEKKNSASDNTMDTVGTVTGKQNDTATLQNTVSDNKDSDSPSKKQADTTNTQTKKKAEDPKEYIPKAEKIEDVGEKIGGARKDIIHEISEKARKAESNKSDILDSIRSMPVSKIFNFDYERLRKEGVSNEAITLLQVIREIIPSKPRSEYKLRRWAEQVFELYYASLKLITLPEAEQRVFIDKILRNQQIDKTYQARMAVGGFDSGLNTGKATLEELGESAGRYDKEGNWVSLKGHWYVRNAGKNGGIFPSRKEAEDALRSFAGENASSENSEKKTLFAVYRRGSNGSAFITVKGKPSIIVADGFKNAKEALDYLKNNYTDLDAKYRSMKEKTDIAFRENRPRKGRDWRNGKNISAEEFRETFGFRGVEFGNWTNQNDRQQALNNAYDAFMDLADAIGKSPRSLSLNGQLGIAFGARGGGRAAAHYEPDKVVINLTKTQGAGSLAHEWWHAIDNYFARRRGQQHVYNSDRTGYKYNTEKKGAYSEKERQELTDAFKELMNAIDNSSYGKRSRAYASMKSSYWSRPTELGARAFAIWIERKLSERGTVNDFLANNPTSTDWEDTDMVTKYYPYPIEGDFDTLDTAFDNLFNAIQEEVDATTGNTILFRELPDQSTTHEQTNDRFNNELSRQIDGTLPKGHIYDLGMPSDTLLNAGLPNLPIEMAASRLSDKSMQENHPFDLSEIRNLPKAIQSPMAIFRSATRLGSFVVMTEIEHHGRNFVVAIQANRRKGRIEVNDIRSVHYRTSNSHIANWVTEGLLEYADKKRMVEWLSKQRYNSAEVRKLFNHATNIIQNFDNPKNNNENIRLREMAAEVADAARPAQVTRQIERLAREMNLPIEIIHAIDDIPDEYTRRYIQGEIDGLPHTIAGYYDRSSGKAYIILPAILQTADPLAEAERTILHEVIAHHGMQALMGRDAYDTLCDEVWQSLPYETRARFAAYVLRKNPRDLTITDIARVAASPALRRAAADEYIAALAEGGVENPTLWQRIKAFFRSILRRMHLYSIDPTDADIRYLLSQARENLAQTSTESVHRGTDIRWSEKNLSNEEKEIIDRAKADGTYLKAPNGEETNLTPRQWVQVRTQAFKQWFGDWEKAARIEKLRHSKPVIVKYNEEYQLNRDSAKQWLKDNIRGEYANKDTGEKIIISKIGINEVTSHGTQNESHLKSLSAIPQMIENSVFIDELPNTKEHDKYDSYRYYVVGMKIDNVDYTAKIVVGVKGDSKYYDHRLTQIEKGTLIDNLNGLSNSVAENQNAHDSISKDSKLLSILQTNASKVVDTNGEPLVVYHGSNYRPLLASGILLPHEGAMGNAVYFSSAFPEAADYAREKLDDFELSEDEVYDAGYITEAFVNVRNEDDISHSKYGIGEIIVAVRNSNQIKSATSNTGAFSSENPDIRYAYTEFNGRAMSVNAKKALENGNIPIAENTSHEDVKNRIEDLFNKAVSGDLKGKPVSIGTLTKEGKYYLEKLSGITFKDRVDFVLNPSDLVHIYKRHFGGNEKDGRNIPLDINDIRSIADIISNPDKVIFSVEEGAQERKIFSFLKEAEEGSYNLLEIYSDKKGNLTAKSFYKSKEGVSQRAISLTRTLHSTSETDGATLNVDAKIPQMFETSDMENENLHQPDTDTDIRFRELSAPEETMDNASQQGNNYARDARTHAAASIDTHNPDLSPSEQAEAVRFRELLTRDFSAASDFLNSANLINAAMQANDGKTAWLNNIQEAVFDSMLRLRLLLDRMKKDGASIPAGFNPYLAENQSRSRAQNSIADFNEDYRRPLIETLAKCINKLREENIGVAIKDNNAAHEALSLYAQARAAVERQEVKEREAREQAKADGTEYKHREWAGLPGIQYAIIALYKGEITDDVEANKNNLQWLQDFATENNIPTVEQYISMVENALQKDYIDILWENIRRISEFQLTTSRDAGILSRGSYQLLTYGYNIDEIIETLYKEQRKKITDDINNGIGDKVSLAADLADLDRRHLEAVATATDLDAPDAITSLVAGGWITQDIANDIHRYYNYYLPLKGHAEITGEDLFDYNSPSMPRNASRIKSVRGHEQLARDPFNQILRDAEGCIVQAERNRWKQQLYHVLSTNRSLANGQYAIQRKYYQVIKLDDGTVRYEPYQRVVTTENNEDIITFVPTSEEIAAGTAVLLNSSAKFDIYVSQKQRSEHETIVYIDGSPISILFYDARIAKAVNGTNEAYPPQWMPRAIIQASRTIPALLTSWNPEFVLLSNPIRDTQEAIANAAIDKGFRYAARLSRNLATVDRDLWAYTGGKLKQKKDNGQPLSQYEKYVTEFFENGGSVNVTQLSDYETTTKDLRKELKRAIKGRTRPSKNFWKRLTEQTELRTRIATYITSRQTGSTIQDAINDAKEITVNFDRRGAQFRNFNLLQMFFNAQMQSVRRQTELMRRHPVRYATTVAILASSKVLIGLGISLLLGGGDDDNSSAEDIIRRYFEINKQLRTRNHIFIIDGEVYRIPVAPAFIPFTTLCEEAAQLAFDPSSRHRNTASQALLSVTSSVLETYVPTLISDPANIMMNINNEQAWRQSFASGIPMSGRALWQPFIEAIYNYDYTGNPIYTEPQFGAQHLPFHRDYRERTGKAYVYTSKILSDLTGGNNIKPGAINIHPEQIEHVVQGLAGGIGTLAGRFAGLFKRVQGESTESAGLQLLYDIPFAARLYGGNMQQRENRYYQSLFFDDKQALEAFRAQQRYIESSQDMQDFDKEYNRETRKYFYDFATADKLATKVRKWRDAHQKGSPEYKQYEAILQDIYRTTDDAFNRLQQSNDNEPYEIIDNPYYIYNNIESQLDKELYNVNGSYMTIDDAARAWAARTRRDKKQYYTLSGDLRKIAKIRDEVKEIKKLFKEIGSDYYPGMPLNGRQQYIYRRIEQKTKALSSLYDEIALDNIQLIE